ncbi:cytochrome P450 [Xylaria bambusicola]|uniref:cytochrome P450 n=1 Tax=Xylaria bambusicola TaxID=326684 RepID=UPI00200800A2|nr:cytochrome P450 [Xylaria bambusicola]KAI0509174.1 cytochrome P450 [Xylaria bambusicola]
MLAAFGITELLVWGTSNPTAFCSAIFLIWYLGWRLWRFTIIPRIWRNEPLLLPYWLPFIGHTYAFVRNPEVLINNGYNHFGTSKPFALTVSGRRTIVLRDIQDVAVVWRNTQALSFDPFVKAVLGAFGISKNSLFRIFADPRDLIDESVYESSLLIKKNPQNKGYMNLERDWFKEQLLAPDALQRIESKYCRYLSESLEWDKLSPTYIFPSDSSSMNCKAISLKFFCRYTISSCSTKTFFGTQLEETAPSFLKDYQEFEEESWKIFYRFPAWLASRSHDAKNKAMSQLAEFLSAPEEKHADLEWLFKTMTRELQYLQVPHRDIAGIVMIIIWAINNNAHKIAFWIIAHLLHSPEYLATVRHETDAAFSSTKGKPDMKVLLNDCPHLDAIWYEVLRVYNASSAIREAVAPCEVAGQSVRVGDQLVAPFRQYHMNQSIFGEEVSTFRPQRFLDNKSLPRTKGYAPFGGGHTYCPGRLFAQREIYLVVAVVLRRFTLALAPRKGGPRMPEVDFNTPSAAAMGPDEDVVVLVQVRKE